MAVAAAGPVKADAAVDLSGPAQFNSLDLSIAAPQVTMPILIAFGQITDPADLAAVRDQLPAMPTRDKKLVVAQQGHGVQLLRKPDGSGFSNLARQVATFTRTS